MMITCWETTAAAAPAPRPAVDVVVDSAHGAIERLVHRAYSAAHLAAELRSWAAQLGELSPVLLPHIEEGVRDDEGLTVLLRSTGRALLDSPSPGGAITFEAGGLRVQARIPQAAVTLTWSWTRGGMPALRAHLPVQARILDDRAPGGAPRLLRWTTVRTLDSRVGAIAPRIIVGRSELAAMRKRHQRDLPRPIVGSPPPEKTHEYLRALQAAGQGLGVIAEVKPVELAAGRWWAGELGCFDHPADGQPLGIVCAHFELALLRRLHAMRQPGLPLPLIQPPHMPPWELTGYEGAWGPNLTPPRPGGELRWSRALINVETGERAELAWARMMPSRTPGVVQDVRFGWGDLGHHLTSTAGVELHAKLTRNSATPDAEHAKSSQLRVAPEFRVRRAIDLNVAALIGG